MIFQEGLGRALLNTFKDHFKILTQRGPKLKKNAPSSGSINGRKNAEDRIKAGVNGRFGGLDVKDDVRPHLWRKIGNCTDKVGRVTSLNLSFKNSTIS